MNLFDGFLKDKKEAIFQILLIIGSLILLNYIVSGIILRFDMTDNHQFTLSKPSKVIAEKIKNPVTVTAYFSAHLPPQLSMVQTQFRNLLDEFDSYSHGNVEFKFINPNKNNKTEQEAQNAGVRPVMVDVRKRDQVSQKRAYMGVVFQYEGKKHVIPVIRPGNSMEYTIASTIKMLTIKKKPKIGLLQGDGEPTQRDMPQLMHELRQEYSVVNVNRSALDTTQVPADIRVLMVIGPSKKLQPKELEAIDQYIMAGGKAVFALNRVNGYMQRGVAFPNNTGIDKLLASYHLPVNVNLVRDVSSTSIGVRQNQGGFQFVNQVRYPYIPIVTHFAKNPITKGLNAVLFKFVSSLDVSKADSSQKITVLAQSSKKSGIATGGYFNISPFQKWTKNDFEHSNLPLAALIKGKFRSAYASDDSLHLKLKESVPTSLIVIGDADFVVNGNKSLQRQQQQQLPSDNISLMVNSVDWLADDTGLMSLRTKGITDRPLKIVSSSTKTVLKYANVFLPILFVLGYGFFRYEEKKKRRRKWMEQGL